MSPHTAGWRCSPAGRTTCPKWTTSPRRLSPVDPFAIAPTDRSAAHGSRACPPAAARVRAHGDCAMIVTAVCHSPAGLLFRPLRNLWESAVLTSPSPSDRDAFAVTPVVDYEPPGRAAARAAGRRPRRLGAVRQSVHGRP